MNTLPADHTERMARVHVALDGLTVAESLGELFFEPENRDYLDRGIEFTPDGTWPYTDDGEMALGITEVLNRHGRIDQDDLAATFARRFQAEPWRGYGPGALRLLAAIAGGEEWRVASKNLFGGMGSFGNGTAMRVAPVAAYFADDYPRVVEEARLASEVTHAHIEGLAGGIAIAVAAAFAWQNRERKPDASLTSEFFATILQHTPEGETRAGIVQAAALDLSLSVETATAALGNGRRVTCQDTVPFCVWAIARHFFDYERAVRTAIQALGDIDTNAAIVGGVVILATGVRSIPRTWLAAREHLRYESGA